MTSINNKTIVPWAFIGIMYFAIGFAIKYVSKVIL